MRLRFVLKHGWTRSSVPARQHGAAGGCGDGVAQSLLSTFFISLHLETFYKESSDKPPLLLLPRPVQKIFQQQRQIILV